MVLKPTAGTAEAGSDGTADERLAGLWFGFLGPPIVWAARFGASYLLVPYACWWGWVPVLHLVTLVSLAIVGVAGAVAWRRRAESRQPEIAGTPTAARTGFMALIGLFSSGFFFLVIAAEGIANLMIDPCITATAPLG